MIKNLLSGNKNKGSISEDEDSTLEDVETKSKGIRIIAEKTQRAGDIKVVCWRH